MQLNLTTEKGRTAQTTRYKTMQQALRHWALPAARGEAFQIEIVGFNRTCRYNEVGDFIN